MKFHYFAGEKHLEGSELYSKDIRILNELLQTIPPKYINQLNYIFISNKIETISGHAIGIYEPTSHTIGVLRGNEAKGKKLASTAIHEFGHVFTANSKVTCSDVRPSCIFTSDNYSFEENSFAGRYYQAFGVFEEKKQKQIPLSFLPMLKVIFLKTWQKLLQ